MGSIEKLQALCLELFLICVFECVSFSLEYIDTYRNMEYDEARRINWKTSGNR